jgi:diadenosine tetraphosphate (Ap4A) HIT family hydrolase
VELWDLNRLWARSYCIERSLLEEPVIDADRYNADVAVHVHIIVRRHGQSFKTPPAYQSCQREASAAPAASF